MVTINEYTAKQNNRTEVGRYVMCEKKEFDSNTRLYLHRLNNYSSAITKDGWWDIFTISTKECNNVGFYICKIVKFKTDRNDYLNMIVEPLWFYGTSCEENEDGWEYFSSLFSRQYFNGTGFYNMNISYLEKQFQLEYEETEGFKRIDEFILNKLANKQVTIRDITKFLSEPSDLYKLCLDIAHNKSKYELLYPLTIKKVGSISSISEIEAYFERKMQEYYKLKLGERSDYLLCSEEVALYWKNKHDEEKKQKKIARNAKKNK